MTLHGSTPRTALLLVPSTARADDVLLRACVNLTESAVDRHLELADGTVIAPSATIADVLPTTTNVDDAAALLLKQGAADVRRRLRDVDSDDEANGDGNTDDDDDDDAADKRTARLFLKCAAAIELLAVQARAYEQALRDASRDSTLARAQLDKARQVV